MHGGAASIATFAILTERAKAAEFTLKFANNLPLDHPLNVRAAEAVARIKKESNGQIEMQVFPNSQLGGDTDMLSQTRSGAIDLFTLSGLILSTLVPATSIYGLGFAFKDYDTAWKAMDGDLGDYLRGAVAKAGVLTLKTNWDNGFRHFFSGTKPIATPDDLKGFKIRVPISPMWTSIFKSLGASPIGINWAETYSALQTKVVDGLENSLANIEASKMYEVQKYCALTNYMWDNFFFLVSRKGWEALPANVRDIVERNFNKAGVDERADVAFLNVSLQKKLEERGMVFSTPPVEPFKIALRQSGFYTEWQKKFDPQAWTLLEKYVGKLDG
jgi:tripartite ATP-independent transporter DctP family solute receptor